MAALDETATTGPGERGEKTVTARSGMGNGDDRGDSPTRGVSHGVSYVEFVLVVGAILLLLAILAYILLRSAPVQYVVYVVLSLCIAAGKVPW